MIRRSPSCPRSRRQLSARAPAVPAAANDWMRLSKAGRADYNRLLVLRTASNYTMPPPGVDPAANIFAPYVGPSVEAAHRIGSTVVNELVQNWSRWERQIPGHLAGR